MQFEKTKKFIFSKLRKELAKHLSYHSVNHIKDVYSAAENLAGLEGVAGEDLTLLLTAVLFHDSGFLMQQKGHEDISCDLAREYLPGFNYSQPQIDRICGMIMATMIPQTPHNLLEEIICDADLDYLGRDDFFTIGNNLYAELQVYGMINSEEEWNQMQVGFLKKHHYFTKSAIKLRKVKKDEHLQQVRSMLKNQ
jgi:uncharacterized protein